ncbi:MAG TPA: isoprenylcysteine carboxylmethyltransferase family protein [Acidobacteriaceae bacterium]|nr:isoprenylcysteine carboxylmethyltransferase family protein [Acidobacteriaceae bacterium]
MKATVFEFRFRVWIIVSLYCLGFYAPWTRFGDVAPDTTAWLALSTTLARWNWLPLDQVTLLVTSLAIFFGVAGAALRFWGTAYLGASIVHSGAIHADRVMAAGPYRHLRNPLYFGSMLFALSVSILMPPSGAVFFLVAIAVFYFRLILSEEDFLARQIGAPYQEYRRRVPRVLPSPRPRVPAPTVRPQWLQAFPGEILPIGYALCLAALAWRYEPRLLEQCLLVCFGLSLVGRALLPKPDPVEA